ncbi:MAG: EamA family transporter [Bacteroidetes bacterium HGW-Bacteroidetes-22]|nr:MAG: EamA family transporter [Bacteroidetes bacterium HGW-Bacteroidetes-22]
MLLQNEGRANGCGLHLLHEVLSVAGRLLKKKSDSFAEIFAVPKKLTYLLAVLAMLFWGISFVWTTIVFEYLEPIGTVFIRLVISSLLLLGGLAALGRLQRIRREDWKLLLLSSVFNPFLYFLGESFGVKYTTPTVSAVMISLIPVVTPVAAFFLLRERLSRLNILGLLVSFGGIGIMMAGQRASGESNLTGLLCLLFAVGTAIGYSITLKKLASRYDAFSIVAWGNLTGVFLFLPFVLIFDMDSLMNVKPDARLITSILLLAVFCSSLAFVFYAIAMRELGVSRSAVFTNFIPAFTALFSWFLIGETIGIYKIGGIVMVVFGVFMTQIDHHRLLDRFAVKKKGGDH